MRAHNGVELGLGRIVALHPRASASLLHLLRDSVPLVLTRQCDRTLGRAGIAREGLRVGPALRMRETSP
jgi:hypothetical protein